MTQSNTPDYLADSKELLSDAGFATSDIWYHGTTSGLLESILEHGIKRSGDSELNQAAKQTMATIGNSYTERREPVYLTQSKELAYFWGQQAARTRQIRLQQEESPVVIAVQFTNKEGSRVKTDVGAAGMLLSGGDKYIEFVDSLYAAKGLAAPNVDPAHADRLDYLNKLGMAYFDGDINKAFIKQVKA